MLCFVHSIISWSFFILQSWIPTFVHSLGTHSLEAVGLLSALPWLVGCARGQGYVNVHEGLVGSIAHGYLTRTQRMMNV